jgi:hypothetical protein
VGGDNFGGAWLVTEYVYNPDGTFAGIVKQRRIVEAIDDGRLRVTQFCEPSDELADHAMGAFAGEWVFDLEVDGAHRHYLGPDVVGLGTEWQAGAMTGSGLWPRFGHEFTSYGVLVAPDRQLTGGFFSKAGRSVADIVGVAVPESAGVEPTLDLTVAAPEVDEEWHLSRTVGPMRIAISRTATQERRLYSMVDAVSGTELTIESTTEFGFAAGRSAGTTTFRIEN